MLKDFIKIQILALLILVINAVATQEFKVVSNSSEVVTPKSKVVTKAKKKTQQPRVLSSVDPKSMLLNALKKSLN